MNNNNTVNRIHPHKFTMWVAIASICMMFAGLTSAYIVKKSQDNVLKVALPNVFWWSTLVIIASSATIYISVKSIKARDMKQYRLMLGLTAFLGLLFALLQYLGFKQMNLSGVQFLGRTSNPGASFLVVIIGLHALHVLGGVVALLFMYLKLFVSKVKNYSSVPVEVMATYWHFVDILWLYLLIFLMYMR